MNFVDIMSIANKIDRFEVHYGKSRNLGSILCVAILKSECKAKRIGGRKIVPGVAIAVKTIDGRTNTDYELAKSYVHKCNSMLEMINVFSNIGDVVKNASEGNAEVDDSYDFNGKGGIIYPKDEEF